MLQRNLSFTACCLLGASIAVNAEESGDWLKQHNIKPFLVMEVEAGYTKDGAGEKSSDIVLATVEAGFEARPHQMLGLNLLLLYEEDADGVEVDEAFITLGNEEITGIYLNAGRLYLPFGDIDEMHAHGTGLVSDPLTLELSEIRESALQFGYASGPWHGKLYAFNGDTRDGGEDHTASVGFDLDFAGDAGALSYSLGINYLNNMADTDSLTDSVNDPDNLTDKTPGAGFHGSLGSGPFSAGFTYVSALENFATADLAFREAGAKPAAWNLEGAYQFKLGDKDAQFALGYQGTQQALALELPERRWLAAFSVGVFEYTTVALEWAHDTDYDEEDGGGGESADAVTLQLAVEF